MADQQRGIQTVELAGEILKLVCASKKSLSLSEIAAMLNLAPGSAYKYLVSLQRTGLLKRNESTLEFEAGSLSLRLGLSKINCDGIVVQSRQALAQIAEKYEVNVFSSLWSNINGPTVVFYREFSSFFNLGFRLGENLALSTATGRLFAAYHAENLAQAILLKPYADAQQFSDARFLHDLNRIRQQGYSVLIDTPDICSYAVPVFNHDNQMVLAMTVFAQTQSVDADKISMILEDLTAIAGVLKGM